MTGTATSIPSWVTRITTAVDTHRDQHTIAVIGWGDAGQTFMIATLQLPAPKQLLSMAEIVGGN